MAYRSARYIKNLIEVVRMIVSVAAVGKLDYRVFLIDVGENIVIQVIHNNILTRLPIFVN